MTGRVDRTEGVVNKVGADYLGVLVMGVFNASIAKADMPRDMRFMSTVRDRLLALPVAHVDSDTQEGCWMGDAQQPIREGSTVKFTITGCVLA